ncbi:hypothetical protein F0562_014199 [Nyssa sinensis]|uniref:DUF7032 domain-containing protein n=1 Tax=Nyssa sinensis TaxID=561372 RepID=A0A5J4ZS50_9ASTE|nr:hypothetical protein F0562_014199 [Nyssa sinensis]
MKNKMGEEKSHKRSKDEHNSPESSARKPSLRQAIELITSLISISHSIKVFPVKWQSIRNKLDELLSGLTAVENCDFGDIPSLSAAVRGITNTLTESYDLARRCVDLSFSGKLLMQSDLDIIYAKFNGHIRHLSEIYTAGLVTHEYAIVVSRPGLGASRDDMKFYVKDLLSRLKIGGTEMKRQALVAFNQVISEDEKYIKIAVEIGNFIGLLVNFLDSQEAEIQEEASKAVSMIAGIDSYKNVLVGAGVIAPLIRVLESGSELGKECAARCLMKLTENSDNAWSVSAHGGATALLKLCSNGDCRCELVVLACGVLKNLLGVEEIKRFMIEEGAISVFINLVRSKDEVLLINSIEFLQSMAFGDESTRQMIELALKAALRLCGTSEEAKKAMGDSGFMPELVKLLNAKSFEVREMAAEALSSMVLVPRNRKRFVQNDQNVGLLLQLLDPEDGNSGNKKFLLSTLMSLTSSNSGRKKILNSGYLKNIEKLADAEVSDAKKIVRKLSSNRLLSMLSGLWYS